MKTWVERYRPQKLKDVAGNPGSVRALVGWVDEWKTGVPKKKAILLHGPAGTGKTSVAYAIANELNYDRIELNASDARTYEVINRIIGSASSLTTLNPEYEKKIIIVDEVDGIHGKSDYGGVKALQNVIKDAKQLMVLIANDPYKLPRDFRNLVKLVEFKRLDQGVILGVLKNICSQEGIETEEKVLRIIATNSNGDLRSAINDLQALGEGRSKLSLDDVDVLTMRDSEAKIFDVLRKIFKTTSCDRAREAMWESGKDADTMMKWISENLPVEYADKGDLARAFQQISRSDVFLGRIIRRQEHGLLSYASDLMSAGVATAKHHHYRGFTPYRYPEIFVLYARTKKQRELLDSAAGKISKGIHCSKREAKEEYFPMLKMVMQNPEMGAKIASELEFTLNEIQYFTSEERAKHIHERAEKLTQERIKTQTHKEKTTQASLSEFGGGG
ncbi:MAG: replication factor C large subunit [Candidatus Hydrothermarchaeales archaeon]